MPAYLSRSKLELKRAAISTHSLYSMFLPHQPPSWKVDTVVLRNRPSASYIEEHLQGDKAKSLALEDQHKSVQRFQL